MRTLSLSYVAEVTGAKWAGHDVIIKKVETDSRKITPGDLFVAIPGERVDGHDYLEEVEKKGAIGALISRKVETTLPTLQVSNTVESLGVLAKAYRSQFDLPIAAVTGSSGKTTVKEMIATILAGVGPVLATRGNLNTDVGVPLTLLQLSPEHRMGIIELGARKAGDIRYLMDLVNPSVSLITNAGVAHLEIFGSEMGIAKAKGEIFTTLSPKGTAVINADDPHADYWHSLIQPTQKVVTFGLQHKADISANHIQLEPNFSIFECLLKEKQLKIHLPVPGIHNVRNALAAAAVTEAMGISIESIQQGLERFKPAAGRLEFKTGYKGACIIDDTYNANPASVRAAILVLSKYPGQKIYVAGDMFELGPNATELHREIGVFAKQSGIHQLLAVGGFTEAMVEGFGSGALHYPNKTELIDAVKKYITEDATVLVKGSRGMRMEEVVNGLIAHYQEENPC